MDVGGRTSESSGCLRRDGDVAEALDRAVATTEKKGRRARTKGEEGNRGSVWRQGDGLQELTMGKIFVSADLRDLGV